MASLGRTETYDANAVGDEDPVLKAGADDLNHLEHALLRRRWRSIVGRPAPATLSRPVMIRILLWREQIARVGDIDARTRAALAAAIVRSDERSGDFSNRAPSASGPRPGSVLVREHAGILHRVMVLDRGYAWNGHTFASLSAVAVAITGTNWNGRRFFGLDRLSSVKRLASVKKGISDHSRGPAPHLKRRFP